MDQNWISVIILAILAGIGKAVRDTISFQWERSVFNKIKDEKCRLWFKSERESRPSHPFWFIWDGWHFGDSLSYLGILVAMIFVTIWLQVIVCAVLFGVTFQLFYRVLFLSDA